MLQSIRRCWIACAALCVACTAPGGPPVEPTGPPTACDSPLDPDGPVELWGAWLEGLASDAFLPRLAEARGFATAGDLDRVLELLDECARDLPAEPAVLAARAGALYEMGFPRAAELELERALRLAPDNGDLWWELALVRDRLGLATKADEAQQQARALAAR